MSGVLQYMRKPEVKYLKLSSKLWILSSFIVNMAIVLGIKVSLLFDLSCSLNVLFTIAFTSLILSGSSKTIGIVDKVFLEEASATVN